MITACGFAVLCFRIAGTFHIFAAYYFQDMNLTDAIPLRHSVRSYTEKPVETEKLAIFLMESPVSENAKKHMAYRKKYKAHILK